MNRRQKKNQLIKDTEEIKKDLNTLVDDSIAQVSTGYENLIDEVQTNFDGAVPMVIKEVDHLLSQYNQKAQELADKVPGGFSKEVAKYPWVSITVALVIGVMIGGFLQPSCRS